jgi:Ni/Co efflux regulator RcnB
VRAPEFRYPRGWGYRRWTLGEALPALFLAEPYYFDYGFLGVPPPPFGTRWVRYGPDALLVNVRSGRIVDVVYDAFY